MNKTKDKKVKKLHLSSETLRDLDHPDLVNAVGGKSEHDFASCPSGPTCCFGFC